MRVCRSFWTEPQATKTAKPLILNGIRGFLLSERGAKSLSWYIAQVHHAFRGTGLGQRRVLVSQITFAFLDAPPDPAWSLARASADLLRRAFIAVAHEVDRIFGFSRRQRFSTKCQEQSDSGTTAINVTDSKMRYGAFAPNAATPICCTGQAHRYMP